MRISQTLMIVCVLSIGKIKCDDEIFEFHPCIGVERVIETFNSSDPFAFNVTILLSKFDFLPEKLELDLIFDALSNITYVSFFYIIKNNDILYIK